MLNAKQKEAVRTTKGRVLVLAGAGSGKTKVIVERISHLIQEKQIAPEKILGLTFTNKAAAEMRARLEKIVGPTSKKVLLATFHSFCMRVLRKEIERLGYTRNFSLYDERDVERAMKLIAKDLLGMDKDLPSLTKTKELINKASNKGRFDPSQNTWHDDFSKELFEKLQTTLRAHNAVNFDNLINLTIQLFEEHPDVLDRYQEEFQYLMIDEYQDTNPAQFRLAELLSAKYNNLCVVGDDDQSIYGWRGAEIANILEFRRDHMIKLEQNYRSTPVILEAANQVISHNKNRHDKKLWSENPSDELIEVFTAPGEKEEVDGVIQRLLKLKEAGVQWKDMAILYRSNALSRGFEMALINASWKKDDSWVRGVPYEVFGGLEFSERSEIKDLLSYLRVIANPKDQEALLRIINVPRRGVSGPFLDELTKINRGSNLCLWELLKEIRDEKRVFPKNPKGVSGIKAFVSLIEKAQMRFSNPPLNEAFTWLLEEIPYKKAIEEDVKSEKMRNFKWENVSECVNALSEFEKENEPILQDFIANTSLSKPSFAKEMKRSNENKVKLMTLHSSKGLEFPYCFIVGLEDHILPHEKSLMETGLEEERRLFYVGITRAKKKLTLSMAKNRMKMGKLSKTTPSRFLFEIPKNLLNPTLHKVL